MPNTEVDESYLITLAGSSRFGRFGKFLHRFWPIWDPKTGPSRPTIAVEISSGGLPGRLGDAALRFCPSWFCFGAPLDRFWNHFGPILDPKMAPKSNFGAILAPKMAPKSDFGPILAPRWPPNRSKSKYIHTSWPGGLRGAIRTGPACGPRLRVRLAECISL